MPADGLAFSLNLLAALSRYIIYWSVSIGISTSVKSTNFDIHNTVAVPFVMIVFP